MERNTISRLNTIILLAKRILDVCTNDRQDLQDDLRILQRKADNLPYVGGPDGSTDHRTDSELDAIEKQLQSLSAPNCSSSALEYQVGVRQDGDGRGEELRFAVVMETLVVKMEKITKRLERHHANTKGTNGLDRPSQFNTINYGTGIMSVTNNRNSGSSGPVYFGGTQIFTGYRG
ncbi:hypothetical protein M409DRAFT_61682 [Zasmidium cellare ATCC 36951]|uniref:Uncharacterized protein n=1 Tax=Zasmidium cellare ATCC 36951 TaxID=1080233 RepID=A0A6A6BUP8_ZASCE|nr:uncharacterized protein M409DRAFT_61682 [Zasmidium cellare ATCC 36951]KAF2158415.1 hypothetical protein M409DRAFT_61682 [Zasmidium cellare ATCC 36951]